MDQRPQQLEFQLTRNLDSCLFWTLTVGNIAQRIRNLDDNMQF
jgi:hypothetical protein